MKYILVMKDDLSGYVWLHRYAESNAKNVAEYFLLWFSGFGIPRVWISEQGSHFKNNLVKNISTALKVNHNFTLPYTPCSNGSVEVVCR